MSAAWLSSPVVLTGMRMSECGKKTPEECAYVRERWHFWYIADYVFALPTIAFFMCAIGIFILSHLFTSLFLRQKRAQRNTLWRKGLAVSRYLSYRGFHVRKLGWNSAPVGVLLLGAAGTIFFFCMVLAPQPYYWASKKFGNSPPLATRSGWLALGCMPFIFATASKTNWITLFTGISYERLQVFHRWIAYAFFVLALLHTFPFIVYHVHWHDMQHHFSSNLLYYWTGIVAILFQAWLTFMSHSTIRSFGYEVFKATHFFSSVIFILTFFWHCDHTLTSWHYFVATAAVYVPCSVFPLVRSAFEYKWTQQARISVEDNGFTKISIPAKCAYWTPGQHCFLRFTGFGVLDALSAHPFTICSLPPRETGDKSELVFYIRHQKGFTHKLYQYALTKPDSTIPVVVDGPYGGASALKLRNADRLLVIAGGSGAGWCLPFLEHFLRSTCDEEQGKSSSTVSGAKHSALRIVLVTRDTASRLWFEQAAARLLARFPSANAAAVQIQVYLTGSAAAATATATSTVPQAEFSEKPQVEPRARHVATTTASSSSGNSDMEIEAGAQNPNTTRIKEGDEFTGRPNLPLIVREESSKAADAQEVLNVYVCGPDTMQDDVRNAVAGENVRIFGSNSRSGAVGVYLHSEHFSWA